MISIFIVQSMSKIFHLSNNNLIMHLKFNFSYLIFYFLFIYIHRHQTLPASPLNAQKWWWCDLYISRSFIRLQVWFDSFQLAAWHDWFIFYCLYLRLSSVVWCSLVSATLAAAVAAVTVVDIACAFVRACVVCMHA